MNSCDPFWIGMAVGTIAGMLIAILAFIIGMYQAAREDRS